MLQIKLLNLIKKYTSDALNCGVCAKCVKTKLALLALGALEKTTVFDDRRIDPGLVMGSAFIYDDYTEATYADLIEPLAAKGYHELADAVRLCLKRYRNKGSSLKRGIKQIDHVLFNGKCIKTLSNWRKLRSVGR